MWLAAQCLQTASCRSLCCGSLFEPLFLCSYHVDRDTLFSHHKASEAFLHQLMALYVSSHYKNTPNDLQLLSDAPAHHVFVLVPPVQPSSTSLPDILCVLQVIPGPSTHPLLLPLARCVWREASVGIL